jgi:hypothetical protein
MDQGFSGSFSALAFDGIQQGYSSYTLREITINGGLHGESPLQGSTSLS